MRAGAQEQYGLPTSIFWKLLLSFKENNTSYLKTSEDSSSRAWWESKLAEHRERDRKTQHITRTNDTVENTDRKKHITRRIRPSHSRY